MECGIDIWGITGIFLLWEAVTHFAGTYVRIYVLLILLYCSIARYDCVHA